jgi:small-conductance mechanosensitive channel
VVSTCVLSAIWDLDLGSLLTALGVSSLVVGLALQEPLGNLFNGISLLMGNPFKKGDWIRIGKEEGKVMEINWRSVKIHTRFNELIIIPNNVLGKEIIRNLSRPDKIHVELLKYGFSYNDPPEKVKAVLLDLVAKNEKILDTPAPLVLTLSYDDFSITYGLKILIRDYEDVVMLRDEITTSVYAAAKSRGLSIPFPKQEIEVHMKK